MRVNKTVSAVLATTFAGAVALGGITAGTAFAAEKPSPQAGQEAAVPQAQKLQQQARALGETAEALKPVADVVEAVLNAPEGRISGEQADEHARVVHEALAPFVQNQQARDTQVSPEAATLEAAPVAATTRQAAVKLGDQVDELLRAAEAGDRQGIAKEAKAALQAAVNLMDRASADSGLPAAETQADAKATQDAQQQDEKQVPATDQGPQLSESQLPPGDPELELLPN
ncbi:hypothetical protein [Streptomyces sp. TR06-5]|uniref:hypothetical protein n=1 Tax=unclassified Streptomyces TaxID=2593676 RepID=UPI0039A053A9